MANMSLSASNLPWLWVIEALASSKEVEASVLIDLVKRTPKLSDDQGKNAREILSLRILESYFAQRIGITANASSAPDSPIGFDSSDHCEDVLQRIVQKTSPLDLNKGGPEMSKWDIQPFIMYKRSCLPKCALQQLKDAIIEGNHPLPASLKERSGLETKNQAENRIPVDCGEPNGIARKIGSGSPDAQVIAANGNLISSRPENGDDICKENPSNRNLLPAKRYRTISEPENLEGQSLENQMKEDNDCYLHSNATKKLKQDATCTRQAVGQNPASLHETALVEDSSGMSVQDAGREGCDLPKEPHVRGLEEVRFSEDSHEKDSASNRCRENCDTDDAEFLCNQQQKPCSDYRLPQDTAGDIPGQNISIDEAKQDGKDLSDMGTADRLPQDVNQQKVAFGSEDNCGHRFEPNDSVVAPLDKDKDVMDHNREPEMSSDSDGYHDERIDIATRKHTFLSSQCTLSPDSLGTANISELNFCMKCNKGGHLLVCSSDACPVMVHEGCLGSAASFDRRGKFYCPFCAYSQAISEYLEVKKKAAFARKDLAAFICLGTENQTKISKRLRRSVQSQLREGGDLDENGENSNRNNVKEFNNPQSGANMEDKQQAERSVSCGIDNPPCGENGSVETNETHFNLTEDKQVGEKMGQGCQSPTGLEELQITEDYNSSLRDLDIVHGRRRHDESGIEQRVLHQSGTDLPDHPTFPAIPDAEESSEEENDKSIASNYRIRFRKREMRKREMQESYPTLPQLRRKKLRWTKVEEDTLKEGLHRFSSVHDRNIPWKKILEYGSDVFQKGRTTIDLKDKWRNVCKGSPKSK